ncbi:S-layer glycoprotein N-glycosyltransferase AglJ [Halapricum hydrolyticum]|uniref:S-layer glycoprotein N-glycosyltransferase AglJ n=1 Tax=Halapricum hydrolyticum TaxID=2979991 RepID=A0AAE3I9M8_9EURY|nr:S-layer glycoprotein N-glycosyltransferase AglJ [Halapricum hydrolyticum]MCU4717100.1 S-layer glycoprotein N-glycosyltransferase AglJ [Halapricum hydrolyticum]MCU4726027.1 S-layer glycoprotein N-glycosyltransferase AglJ [Halapricum hydrolyticum]
MGEWSDVCVLVPTYNEAAAIGDVVGGFREQGFEHILVMDGGSTDGTREIAREHGAEVRQQTGSGKGQAVREAISLIEQPYVLLVDGDATYRPEDAPEMLDPLLDGEAEHVIGDRFADMEAGAMSRLNRVGNRLINSAFRFVHGRDFADILSGYRAFTTESVRRFALTADGFGIETEMAVECVKHNVPTEVVPITYLRRPEEADTNLNPFRDGAIILLTLYRMAKTNNPLFYFGSIGGLSVLAGIVLGAYVAVEWFTRNVSHEVIAVLATLAIIFGVQLLIFGVLSDMIVTLHREQLHFIERVASEGERARDDGADQNGTSDRN